MNANPEFSASVVRRIAAATGSPFTVSPNYFASMSSQDAAVELSGQLRGVAVTLLEIANDLRWMNSRPAAGLGEITLPALQPGSRMMPGKVIRVIPKAVAMVCARVTRNDTAILMAGASSEFQVNLMQPLVAWNSLSSIGFLSAATRALATRRSRGSPSIKCGWPMPCERTRPLLRPKRPGLAMIDAPKLCGIRSRRGQ